MNWQPANFDNVEQLQKCAINNNVLANNYSAVNSILYGKKFNSSISINGGWIFEKYYKGKCPVYCFPHNIEGDNSELNSALNLIVEDSKKYECELKFRNVTEQQKDKLLQFFKNVEVVELPELSDYIYLSENLAKLPGKTYSKKRNHVNQFKKKHPNFRFEKLSLENLDAAREVENKWLSESIENEDKNDSLADLQNEKLMIFEVFDNFDFFSKTCGMSGGIVYEEEKPFAFCLASELSTDVTDIHFEKCISPFAHDGGYAIINMEFAKTVKTKYINREEDLGIEGLRKAKLSYYPEMLIKKFLCKII